MANIEYAVSFMEMIAKDDTHGYAQDNRGGKPDYDCSSLVGTALNKAGFNVNPASTTRNLYDQLIKCGFVSIGITDARQRGDIFLSPGHHVVMCTDANSIVHASINERGGTTKGIPGDQTGREICTRSYYTPSYGWTYHLRYPQQQSKTKKRPENSKYRAIDISQYNPIRDYATMGNQFEYVLIRIGYRGAESGTIVEDKLFRQHIDNCLKNDMSVGIYFYDQSINEAEAEEQAAWIVNNIKKYKVALPIFIDSEYSKNHTGRADNISKEQRTKNIVAFCEKIKKLGYTPGVYSGNSWFTYQLEFDKLSKYIIWCARYSTEKPTVPKYDMWQYGSEKYIWADKAIDSNIIYTDIKNAKAGDSPKPNPTPSPSGSIEEKPILLMGRVNITEGTLNVRKLPTADSPVVTQLKKGQYVQLRGDFGDWYRMDLGYVSKKYIKEVHGIVTGDNLRVRSTPDSSLTTNVVTTLPINTEVIVCTAGNGWYYVLLDNGTTGWVNGQYLRLK